MKLPRFQNTKLPSSVEKIAAYTLLVIGIIFRVRQYLAGRSLWLDEAMLALNIVNRDFVGLFQPLDYDQGAPIGFLLLEKLANLLFGDHEFVFRLFPLVTGVTALGLFYIFLQRTNSGIGLLTGLALFAISPELIYYSSEVKQYITDVAITIGLLLIALPLLDERNQKQNYAALGVTGMLALWFSYPAFFVLASVGIGLFIRNLKERSLFQDRSLFLWGAVWLISFALLYYISIQGLSQNSFLIEYWQENFMPMPPWSDWSWFLLLVNGLVKNQIGVSISAWIVFPLTLLGYFALSLKNKDYGNVILLVFIFSLISAGLQLYPIGGRISLYLVPLLIVMISQSIHLIQQSLKARYQLNWLVPSILSLYILFSPTIESFNRFLEPSYREHIRPAMVTLSDRWQAGDAMFISYGAESAFLFYAERYGLSDVAYQTSNIEDYKNPANILSQVDALDGNARVWILITHVYERGDFNEKDYLLAHLDSIGDKKREIRKPGTSVHLFLYDLSQ